MCGRYALYASEQEIVTHFHQLGGACMRPRYNIAPAQTIPVISAWQHQIEFCQWGFIPSWAKREDKTPAYINARKESLAVKPTFKSAFLHRRCLIPASGYYEWRDILGKKYPYYLSSKTQSLMGFAGLMSTWEAQNGEKITTCAIITATATTSHPNSHGRMPVVIAPQNYRPWLSGGQGVLELEMMLDNVADHDFKIHAVSTRMNSPHCEGLECIRSL